MHFAWKDENFLIKMLTFIMIFIVVVMVAISPVFAYVDDNDKFIKDEPFNDVSGYNITYPDAYYNATYRFSLFYSVGSSAYFDFFFSDTPFVFDYYKSNVGTYYYFTNSGEVGRYGMSTGLSILTDEMLTFSDEDINYSTSSTYKYTFYTTYNKPQLYKLVESIDNGFSPFSGNVEIVIPDDNISIEPIPEFINPSFITTDEELATGNFQTLKINAGSLDSSLSEDFYLAIFDITNRGLTIDSIGDLPNLIKYKTVLNFSSKYMVGVDGKTCYYIPQSDLGIDLSNGKQYYFVLLNSEGERYDQSIFTVGGLTPEEELQNKQDEMNQKLDEQNETSKGIWETIKEVLSYINPFSENFFVYKLIDLLIEAIKSLFIPSDDFFSTYFTDLKDWFSDRLGFLFYPFELFIDILNKILDVDFSEPVFSIPDINEPFTNKKIISATTFNLNSLLTNNTWNTVHSIYLIIVDAFIVFGLVNLFLKKYKEVTTE